MFVQTASLSRISLLVIVLLTLAACSKKDQADLHRETEPRAPKTIVASAAEIAPKYAWLQAVDSGWAVRAVVEGSLCPQVRADDTTTNMTPRNRSAVQEFPVTVCEAPVPASTKRLSVAGKTIATPPATIDKAVVLGDTGCRVKGTWDENCNGRGSGPRWAFAEIAAAAGRENPDLVLHVGDYLYREGACMEGNAGCEGSPFGDNWPTWTVDFFEPVGDLLSTNAWVFTRGNHEDCARSYKGWFLFLDGRPLDMNWVGDACPQYSEPWAVRIGDRAVVNIDTAELPDDSWPEPSTEALPHYVDELSHLPELIGDAKHAWTLTHRPFWIVTSVYEGDDQPSGLGAADATLQAAIAKQPGGVLPSQIDLLLAGHVHAWQLLRTTPPRPPQLVSGAGGTALNAPITDSMLAAHPDVLQSLNVTADQVHRFDEFSYTVLEARPPAGWLVSVHDREGENKGQFSTGSVSP